VTAEKRKQGKETREERGSSLGGTLRIRKRRASKGNRSGSGEKVLRERKNKSIRRGAAAVESKAAKNHDSQKPRINRKKEEDLFSESQWTALQKRSLWE